MAEQTIVNKKADSFEKYLKDNNLNFFTRFDKGGRTAASGECNY